MSSVAPSSSSRYVDVRLPRTPDLREQQRPAAISRVCPPLRDRLRLRVSAHLSDPSLRDNRSKATRAGSAASRRRRRTSRRRNPSHAPSARPSAPRCVEQGRPISRVATRKRAQRTPIANSQTAAEKVHRVYGVFIRERTPLDDASDDTRELTPPFLFVSSLYCLHT